LLAIGSYHLRAQLHVTFGGNPRAGICPTKAGPILIFSDPASGRPFGYDAHDYLEGNIYHYTGEGRVGNQQLVRGNRALLDSSAKLLLFARQDAKTWRFVGEVSLASPPYLEAKAKDQNGTVRTVLVFRFQELRADFSLL
jgi:5-methylcytosine-specific restriction protein A